MSAAGDFARHVAALTGKEVRQILRDKSVLLLGIALPIVLLLLLGYGMSFDVKDVRIGVVTPGNEPVPVELAHSIDANKTVAMTRFKSRVEGMKALKAFEVEALVILEKRDGSYAAQVIVDGIDATRASMVPGVASGIISSYLSATGKSASGGVTVTSRIWFNESMQSRWYIVPGIFVIVLTLTGTMMTCLVIAREWERGTMEAMLATPISPLAFLLSKILPYFVLGMIGCGICLAAALFLYEVPLRGSLTVILLSSSIYILTGLCVGLSISSVTRSQFLASQVTVFASFLPAVLFSGFVFDLRSAPAWAAAFAKLLPPVYYLELLKVGFLTGGIEDLVAKNFAVLIFFALFFLLIAYRQCAKRIRR